MGGAAKTFGDIGISALTGGIADAYKGIKTGSWSQGIDRAIDPGGAIDYSLRGVGKNIPQGIRSALPAIGGIVGSYWGPFGAAAGSGVGSKLAGADYSDSWRNAGLAAAGTWLTGGINMQGGGGAAGTGGAGNVAGETAGTVGSGTGGAASGTYQGTLGPQYSSTLLNSTGEAASATPYYTNYSGMLGEQVGAGAAGSSANYPYTLGESTYNSPSASETYTPGKTKMEDTNLGASRTDPYANYTGMLGEKPYGVTEPSYNLNGENILGQEVNPQPLSASDLSNISDIDTAMIRSYNTTEEPGLWDKTKGYAGKAYDKMFGNNPQATGNTGTNTPKGKGGMFSGSTLPLAALMLGSNYLSSAQQKKQSEDLYNQQKADIAQAQAEALANWQKYAFPNQSAITAATSAGKSGLAQNTLTAKRSLDESLAARGIAGGGIAAGEYGKLERNRQLNYANLVNQLTQYANTPTSAVPITTNYAQQSSYTPWASGLNNIVGNVGGTAAGMQFYNWLKNNGYGY